MSTTYYILLNDKRKSHILETEFKKQETLELNPEIYHSSKVIKNLEDALEAFSKEPDPELSYLTEDQLREIVKDHFPKVRKYFTN